MTNRQEKAEPSPPRREHGDLPPITLKISHKLIHRTWRRRTSAVTFSAYPVRRCEIIGRKPQNTKWLIGNQRPTTANFRRFQFFHSLSMTAGRGARRSTAAETYILRAIMEFRCAQPVVNSCVRGGARSTNSSEPLQNFRLTPSLPSAILQT